MANSKDVVVTGVSTGISWGTTKVLVSKGFRVFGSVRKLADADTSCCSEGRLHDRRQESGHLHGCERAAAPGVCRLILGISSDSEAKQARELVAIARTSHLSLLEPECEISEHGLNYSRRIPYLDRTGSCRRRPCCAGAHR